MTGPMLLPVDIEVADLGRIGDQLGSGGQAKIFDLPELTLPDVPGRLVYKQYKPNHLPGIGMGRIVIRRQRLASDAALLARLDAACAWPVRQVHAPGGAVLGLVLPRIPDSFFHDLQLPSGAVDRLPREVQFLFVAPDRALQRGTPAPTPVERLTICRDFAATLAFLHRELDVTFGDINARNAVFRLSPAPTVMFVDCDAARARGDMAPQLNAPDWDPPEGGNVLSQSTDCYKLGLFVLRCLTPDAGCSVNRDPAAARGALDPTGMTLLRAALDGPADQRPTAEEWHRYLRRALGEALEPPRLMQVTTDRTIVPTGEPLTLSWEAQEADTVVLTGVGIPATSVSGIAGSGSVVLFPSRTGVVTVTARNQLGEDSARTGPLAVLDIGSFQDLQVPMPVLELPRLSPGELPDLANVLPQLVDNERVPVVVSTPLADLSWPAGPALELVDVAGPPSTFESGPSMGQVDVTTIMSGSGFRDASSEPIDIAGPPPLFEYFPSTAPVDVTAIMSGSGKVRP